MKEAGVNAAGIDLLQMHGTATAYNDEMESKAACLAGVQDVPVQSLKPYFGHTMGASGVIETIIAAAEIQEGIIAGTKGYEKSGVSVPLNVCASNRLITKNLVLSSPAGKSIIVSRLHPVSAEPMPQSCSHRLLKRDRYRAFAKPVRAKCRDSEQ